MKAAKKRGEHIGCKPALSAIQKKEAQKTIERGDRPAHVAKVLRVELSTLIVIQDEAESRKAIAERDLR